MKSPNNIDFAIPNYKLSPIGCPLAGFYADLGHTLTRSLGFYLNEIYSSIKTNNFLVDIDSTKMWVKYQCTESIIDYYKEMFQVDVDYNLPLPVTGIMRDEWTVIKETNFTDLYNVLRKYFKLSDKQQALYQSVIQKYNFNSENTIGVFYRGTDKRNEVPLVMAEDYVNKVKKIIEKEPHLKIMIQTDQQQVKDLFTNTFKNQCFYIQELPHTADNIGIHQRSKEEINKYNLATYLDLSVRMLAQCKHLVLGMSNVSTFIGAHRNNPLNVYQFTDKYS